MIRTRPWWRRVLPWLLLAVAVMIVAGHVNLWRTDIPTELKWRMTALNAAGWAVILLPAFGVSMWAKARLKDRER